MPIDISKYIASKNKPIIKKSISYSTSKSTLQTTNYIPKTKMPKNIAKFSHIFAACLIIFGILSFLFLVLIFIYQDSVIEKSIHLKQDDINYIKLSQSITILYCIIGGIGLFKLKKWGLYIITIPGIMFFIQAILALIILVINGGLILPIFDFALKLPLGICSVYLLQSRRYF